MRVDITIEREVVDDVIVVVLDAVEDAIAQALDVERSRVCVDDQAWTVEIIAAEQDTEILSIPLPQAFRDRLETIKQALDVSFSLDVRERYDNRLG